MIKATIVCLSSRRRLLWVTVCTMAVVTMLELFIRKCSYSSEKWNKSLPETKCSTNLGIDKDIYDIMNMKQIKFDPAYKNPCWLGNETNGPIADGRLHCLPYFYLMGIKKSGTTDLFNRIALHPEFVSSVWKELQWFPRLRWGIKERMQIRTIKSCTDIRSAACYMMMFDRAAHEINEHHDGTPVNSLITADGTPANLHMHTNWALLPGNEGLMEPKFTNFHYINHLTPNSKIVIIIRDPVTRLYSDYWHMSNKQTATPEEFHVHVTMLTQAYTDCFNRWSMRRCIYNETMRSNFKRKNVLLGEGFTLGFLAFYMTEMRNVFGEKRIHSILTDEYYEDMVNTLQDVYNFLDMRKLNSQEIQRIIKEATRNSTKKKTDRYKEMLNKTRDMLYSFYEPFNREMATIMNDQRYLFPKS